MNRPRPLRLPRTLLAFACLLGLTGAAGGCSTAHKKVQHEQAVEKWSAARASVLASLAQDQYKNGNFDEARKSIAEALKLEPKSAGLHVIAAKIEIERNQLEVAASELAEASKDDPKNAEADYLSGVIYQRWSQPQRAYDAYSRAADKDQTELAYLLAKAEMLVAMDRQQEALRLLQDRLAAFEHSAVIRDAIGQLLVGQKRYPEAVEILKEASVLATDDNGIREHLAMATFLNQQYREALELFTRLLSDKKLAKRGDLFLAQGECQIQLNKPLDARASFETATDLMPASLEAWLSLSKAAVSLGDIRRADMSLRRATALDPDNAEVNLLTGYVRLKQGRIKDAETALTKASTVEHPDALTFCMLGYIAQKNGASADAVRYYRKALDLKPGDELASKLLASVDLSE